MKLRYIFVIIFLAIFLILTYLVSTHTKLDAKAIYSESNDKYDMKNLKENNEKYNIDIYYPNKSFDLLNTDIKAKLQKIVEDFKSKADFEHDNSYTLQVSFDCYEYKNYMSFAFNVFTDVGGAHPNTITFTINYDIKNNKIIDIVELTKIYKYVLKVFSTNSYNSLKDDKSITEYGNEDMLKVGVEEKTDNFKNFVFDKNYIIIFFNQYDVAPYVSGSFVVKIPYSELE